MKETLGEIKNLSKSVASNGKYCLLGEIPNFFEESKNIFVLDIYCANEDLNNQISYMKVILRGSSDNNLFVDCFNIKDITGSNARNRLWATRAIKNGNSVLVYMQTKNNEESNILVVPFENEKINYIPRMEFSDTFTMPENYIDHAVGGWVLAR